MPRRGSATRRGRTLMALASPPGGGRPPGGGLDAARASATRVRAAALAGAGAPDWRRAAAWTAALAVARGHRDRGCPGRRPGRPGAPTGGRRASGRGPGSGAGRSATRDIGPALVALGRGDGGRWTWCGHAPRAGRSGGASPARSRRASRRRPRCASCNPVEAARVRPDHRANDLVRQWCGAGPIPRRRQGLATRPRADAAVQSSPSDPGTRPASLGTWRGCPVATASRQPPCAGVVSKPKDFGMAVASALHAR